MSELKVRMRLQRDVLKFIKGVVGTCVDEVKVSFTPEGFSLKAVDPAHVMMMRLTATASNMNALFSDHYECNEPFDVGLDSEYLYPVEFRACEGNEFCVEIDDTAYSITGRLSKVSLDDWTELCDVERRMETRSLEGMQDPKVPKLAHKASIVTTGAHFHKACEIFAGISYHLGIVAVPERAYIEAMDANGLMQTVVLSRRPNFVNLRPDDSSKVKSLFPMDYIGKLAGCLKDCPRVEVQLSNDLPITVLSEYKGIKVELLLAPRIESD